MAEYKSAILRNGILAVVIVTAILGVAFYTSAPLSNKIGGVTNSSVGVLSLCQNLPSIAQGIANASADSPTANFTIIEANSGPYMGMNGSAYYEGMKSQLSESSSTNIGLNSTNIEPWPVMRVFVGQTVNIRVINCSLSQHGFAIGNYSQPPAYGLTVLSNESATLTLVATKSGNFLVFEQISSVIHSSMQNGRLVVQNKSS